MREVRYKTSPLAACGCYLVVLAVNLAFWLALIYGVVKLVRLAWAS